MLLCPADRAYCAFVAKAYLNLLTCSVCCSPSAPLALQDFLKKALFYWASVLCFHSLWLLFCSLYYWQYKCDLHLGCKARQKGIFLCVFPRKELLSWPARQPASKPTCLLTFFLGGGGKKQPVAELISLPHSLSLFRPQKVNLQGSLAQKETVLFLSVCKIRIRHKQIRLKRVWKRLRHFFSQREPVD